MGFLYPVFFPWDANLYVCQHRLGALSLSVLGAYPAHSETGSIRMVFCYAIQPPRASRSECRLH